MTGASRALLYRLAVETGLRAGELASLKRSSFGLDADSPTVTVEAAYSKHRREDILPLRVSSAAALAEFMASKLPTAPAFAMPPGTELAAMLREDLAAARQAWMESHRQPQGRTEANETAFLLPVDDSGRVVDFHALRHTAGSLLAAGGVHPKVAQSLMRHSDINLTLSRYTHVYAGQEAQAVAALPDFKPPVRRSAQATGTDNATPQGAAETLARNLALQGVSERTSTDKDGRNTAKPKKEKNPMNIDESQRSRGDSSTGPCRIRTYDQGIMSPLL